MKVCVIVRHLAQLNAQPVAMNVIAEPLSRSYEVDELEHYFKSEADTIIANFRKEFVDFSAARFYTYILETE